MAYVTLLLARSDVTDLLDVDQLASRLRDGFRRDDEQRLTGVRARTDLPGEGTATALLPGVLPGVPAYTVKVNAKFPSADPALRGVVCLHSLDDGALLAVLDSASLTAWRTGLAAAVATDMLAAPGAATVGIVGAGVQASVVLRGLGRLRQVTQVTVADLDPARGRRFAEQHEPPGGPPVQIVGTARDVLAAAQIAVFATWSREPLASLADTRPGQHLTSLGTDEPGKRELAGDILGSATVVVDDLRLARSMGALSPPGQRPVKAATLGQVLRGEHPGRSSPDELTVYAPVGLPWQDLAIAWQVYQAARKRGRGVRVDLLA